MARCFSVKASPLDRNAAVGRSILLFPDKVPLEMTF